MNPVWGYRAAAGLGVGVAIACALLLRPAEVSDPFTAVADEPVKISSKFNTGKPPGDGFLMDLTTGFDDANHYISNYEMDVEWIKIAFRRSNIRWLKDGMRLEMRPTRGALPFSGAEFQRTGFYGYGRYEVVMKASAEHGAVASFFTHTDGNFQDPHDEIDFEFVGKSPRQVHLNYFRRGKSDPVDIPLWFDTGMGEHLYAFEWSPDLIRWYVDGHKIHEVSSRSSPVGIPSTTSRVIVNLWAGSGSSIKWTGEPRFQQASAMYRCISHVPIGKTGPQCSDKFDPPPRK